MVEKKLFLAFFGFLVLVFLAGGVVGQEGAFCDEDNPCENEEVTFCSLNGQRVNECDNTDGNCALCVTSTIFRCVDNVCVGSAGGTGCRTGACTHFVGDSDAQCEATPLFTQTNKLFLNEPLNTARTIVTENELTNLLADGDFNGVTFTQSIEIGSDPRVVFDKLPTSANDPSFGLAMSTSAERFLYKTRVDFANALDFSPTFGREILFFRERFTILPESAENELNLVKNFVRTILDADNTQRAIIFDNLLESPFQFTLVSATDNEATITIRNNAGGESRINLREGQASQRLGLFIGLISAEENNNGLKAELIISPQNDVLVLSDERQVGLSDGSFLEGTLVDFDGDVSNLRSIEISMFAPDSEEDAILVGRKFDDPVFGTFAVDFPNVNIDEDDDENREQIDVRNFVDNEITLIMTDHRGMNNVDQGAAFIVLASFNEDVDLIKLQDTDEHKVHVFEREQIFLRDLVVVGNEDNGGIFRLEEFRVDSSTPRNSRIVFRDAFSGDRIEATITTGQRNENLVSGTGTIDFLGINYNLEFQDDIILADDEFVRLNYPDSVGAGSAVIYPTIETSKGAKIAFYQPKEIDDLGNWDGNGNALDTLMFPDGDGYTSLNNIGELADGSHRFLVGSLVYHLEKLDNKILVLLENPEEVNADIQNAALIIFEETDHQNNINALVVTLEGEGTPDNGIGVSDVIRTWERDSVFGEFTFASNPVLTGEADLWGTGIFINSLDADQRRARITYPDEQVEARIFIESGVCSDFPDERQFIRGDADSNGRVDLTDAVFVLDFLFRGGETPRCMDGADADDDGAVTLTDAIRVLGFLFQGGVPPPAPFPAGGVDPTADELSCAG